MAKMLKAIHAQESKKAAREKATAIVAELQGMKLKETAKKVSESIDETLTHYDFPSEHWMKIRTKNTIERLNRDVARTQWGNKKYMNMMHLEMNEENTSVAG